MWRLVENFGISVEPTFSSDFPEAAVSGANASKRRRSAAPSSIPPMWTVDEDWHVCQAICKGIEGQEWERLYCKYVEMHTGQQSQDEGFVDVERRRNKWESALRSSGGRQFASGATVRQALWEAHMQSPTAAQEEALRRTDAHASVTRS